MTAPEETKRPLLPLHADLIGRSAISDQVAAARGYYSATEYQEIKILGFANRQITLPALVIPIRDVNGKIALHQIRPDAPRVDREGRPIKYETQAKHHAVIDVHPFVRTKLSDPSEDLWIMEGARKADAAVSAGLCCISLLGVWGWRGTNSKGGKAVLPCWDSIALNGRRVFLCFDSDAMTKEGVKHALERLAAFLRQRGAHVRIVYLPEGEDGLKIGLDDYLAAGHSVDELRALADAQPASKPRSAPKQAAQVQPLGQLLALVEEVLRTYVVFPQPHHPKAIALWVAHAHTVEHAETTPYLHITSVWPRSGKSRLLEILEPLVAKPWAVITPSEAVIFRKVDQEQPTLLFDEIDAIYGPKAKEHEMLRALMNAGNRRGAKVARCVGEGAKMDLKDYSVFCPKAFAGIGDLPPTIADRCIRIKLLRRLKTEPIKRFRRASAATELAPAREAFAAWAASVNLSGAEPGIPDELGDRAAEGWEPLFAIAEVAGGDWPKVARDAAISLSSDGQEEETSLQAALLSDLRMIFGGTEALFTETILHHLKAIDTSPWAELHQGKGITGHTIARILRPFGIRSSGTLRIGMETKKGYRKDQFLDAWARFLPPRPPPSPEGPSTVTPSHVAGDGSGNGSQPSQPTQPSREKPSNSKACDGVTLQPVSGMEGYGRDAEEDKQAELGLGCAGSAEIDTLVLELMRGGLTPGLAAYKASQGLACPMPSDEQVAQYKAQWAVMNPDATANPQAKRGAATCDDTEWF